MRIDTMSGLHGQVIAFTQTARGSTTTDGVAIVRRDDYPEPHRPYSVHTVAGDDRCTYASNGAYDLTLSEAQAEFRRRGGSVEPKTQDRPANEALANWQTFR